MGEQDILSFGGGGNGMESKRLIDPVQIGGNLGILVGLIFVGLQIQQDRELKRAELPYSNYSRQNNTLGWEMRTSVGRRMMAAAAVRIVAAGARSLGDSGPIVSVGLGIAIRYWLAIVAEQLRWWDAYQTERSGT